MATRGEKENKLKGGALELWPEEQGAIQIRTVRKALLGKQQLSKDLTERKRVSHSDNRERAFVDELQKEQHAWLFQHSP